MKKTLLTLISTVLAISSFAQAPAPPVIAGASCNQPAKVWDKTLGGNFPDYLNAMLVLNDGGYLAAGYTGSFMTGDVSQQPRGGLDFWLVKINANGSKVWDKRFGGDDNDVIQSIIATTDGNYLLFGLSLSGKAGDKTMNKTGASNYWLVKVDANGTKIWDKQYGGGVSDLPTTIIATSDGGYLLGGSSNSYIWADKTETTRGEQDYWIVKIDADGTKQWDKTYGGDANDLLSSIIPTTDGNYLLGGTSYSSVSGDKAAALQGVCDYWVVKIKADGTKLWDKTFGGTDDDTFRKMIATTDGNYLLGGYSASGISGNKTQTSKGSTDCWLVKIDTDGIKLWDKALGGAGADEVGSMVEMPDGNILLGGSSNSEISGDKTEDSKGVLDYWLVKFNSSGTKTWDKTFGGNSFDNMKALLVDADGSYILGGGSMSDMSGDKTEASQGGYDMWVVKVAPCQPVTTFCEGQTYTLTASGCTGTINWSTGATGNSILVSTAGTYTATCTVNNETSTQSNSIVITPTTVSLNGNAITGTNKAVNTITSTQTIPSGVNTSYEAGKSISLQGTFQAQPGSVFRAEIKGCE